MIMSVLCGKTSLKAIARFAQTHREILAEYIPLPRGKAPSYSTIQRLSHRLDINHVCNAFTSTGSAQAIVGWRNMQVLKPLQAMTKASSARSREARKANKVLLH